MVDLSENSECCQSRLPGARVSIAFECTVLARWKRWAELIMLASTPIARRHLWPFERACAHFWGVAGVQWGRFRAAPHFSQSKYKIQEPIYIVMGHYTGKCQT